jgi:hypothetical protein
MTVKEKMPGMLVVIWKLSLMGTSAVLESMSKIGLIFYGWI